MLLSLGEYVSAKDKNGDGGGGCEKKKKKGKNLGKEDKKVGLNHGFSDSKAERSRAKFTHGWLG